MDKRSLQPYLAAADLSLAQAMRAIDANGDGILFLAEADGRLLGCITDGDIRRYLLAGGKMTDPALNAANRAPKTARTEEEAKRLYHKKNFVVIPILDGEGRIVSLYNGDGAAARPCAALHVPVVINAGGRGTRLEPFTKVLPKPLIPVGELPIIELIMQEYRRYSCDEFHIIVNYKRELMKAYFAENENRYNVAWYDEDKPLGTGGGLRYLKGKLRGTFFFANCDALLTANYERILQFHKENGNVITMICAYRNTTLPYGIVEMGENGRIERMEEKPTLSFLVNTGIYVVEPEVIDDIEEGKAVGFPEIVEKERQKGRKVAVFPVSENEWMDMGQLSELEKMRQKLYGEER